MSQDHLDLPAPTPQMNEARDFLMLVKTYPVPSKTYGETVCCAAIDTARGGWVRIFPVNFRSLGRDEQFKKWQFIRAGYSTARNDNRPESIRVHQETISAGEWIPPAQWARRRSFTDPLVVPSIEWLRRANQTDRTSLGLIRPKVITDLLIEPADRWDADSDRERIQLELEWEGRQMPVGDLEPIPYRFKYKFRCDDSDCRTDHELVILDWEISQAFRSWRKAYEEASRRDRLREKYLDDLPSRELHLIVGTHHVFGSWMVVGVFAIPWPKVGKQDGRSARHLLGEERSMTGPWVDLETQEGHGLSSGHPDRRLEV
jgi:hypothetical protein